MMIDSLTKHGDSLHVYSPDEMQTIIRDATEFAVNPNYRIRELGQSAFHAVTGFIQAKYDGGPQPGNPTFGVLHDAETPLANGYAASIARYFSGNTNETSAHFMAGPDALYQMLDTSRIAWHCGNGNTRSVGVEQTGYASDGYGTWTGPAGQAQMARIAELMRELKAAHGIGLHWMSDGELVDAWHGRVVGGWATHHQCSRVLGGSTHTDPDPNYPLALLMQIANGAAPGPTPPPPPPGPATPSTFLWNLPGGNYYGNINGPAQSHGGYNASERPFVKNIQQWLVFHGCTSVPAAQWSGTGWCDGIWGNPTDAAMANWHARFYPNQPQPTQCWGDDYARLARA